MPALDSTAPDAFDVVHARILRFFPDLVAELGGDCDGLLRRVGIDPDQVSDGERGPTYRQIIHLFEFAASELRCPDFGMRLASLQGGRMYGPLGRVMRNSRTFGEAVHYVSRHSYAHSLAAGIWLRPHRSGKSLFVGHDILLEGLPNKSQAMEQLLLLGQLGAAEITSGQARVRRVHFRHQPLSSRATYRRYFGCEVRFGQNEDGVVFFERDLACPITGPDAQAYQAATAYIEAEFTRHRPPLHAHARGVIMHCLDTELCTNDRVAAELKLHPRTMHRRLKAEGTSFQQIKDEVRRDLMIYYLQQTDLSFARVSERLGFAEQSVMTRSCQRWFSAPPTALRHA